MKKRCDWVGDNELMISYHDIDWGTPVHEDHKLFEFIVLEGQQAGLSWQTVLNKRENYRKAFDSYDCKKIAEYNETKIDLLLNDAGIIRNKLKIEAIIKNAKAFLMVQNEFETFDKYIWQFVNYTPQQHTFINLHEYPASTEESEKMSKELLKRGFKFVGPTICYAFMQAVGLVNDHQMQCFRYVDTQTSK